MTTKKTDDLIPAFDRFVAGINERYAQARDLLLAGRYDEAQSVLAGLGIAHARTSLSLRRVLIRRGLVKGEES